MNKGETLSQLGQRTDLGRETAMALARASAGIFPARKMRAGHTLRVQFGNEGNSEAVHYQIDQQRYLAWHRDGKGGFGAEVMDYPRTVHVREAFGRIRTSLFEAGRRAGLSDKIIMELARIYGWDIDLAHDIRRGDWFRVLYRENYRGGERVGDGPILAAEFFTRGESHRVIRFTDAQGQSDYFHPDGRSVRKAFLRTPVRFDRITSGFSRGREHPLLGRRRAHEGVDYGANPGTPVRATGDGRVVFRDRKGGYGRVVKIRHAGRFTTVYAHLSRFGNIKQGQPVSQGQTVGYVGQSGLATGPHLHYEFQVGGHPRNPLKVDLPDADPLADEYRPAFQERSHHYTAWLDSIGPANVRFAAKEDGDSPSS
ncbi:M23 family metallopeptidase [Thiohalorhabdus sp.]|uniref:M23 family metallopeptidase n=1 Tax=Thiohalorhabdus sp. TaxID=3094134 RepID=UPI002FC2BF08